MQHINDYDKERARRAQIEAEYRERVKGELFKPGNNKDNLTGLSTPQDKPRQRAVINSWKIKI